MACELSEPASSGVSAEAARARFHKALLRTPRQSKQSTGTSDHAADRVCLRFWVLVGGLTG